jgi:sugar phosphate isomerase/epimerase
MSRLAISEFSTYRWSLEEEIQELSRRGIREIGIWRTKLSDVDIDSAADALYSADMKVSSLSWAGGFTGSCGMTHIEAIDDGLVAIRTAARIGAQCLIVHPGNAKGHTRNHASRLFREALDRMLPVAMDFGVSLGIELTCQRNSPAWTIFESTQQAIDLVKGYSVHNLGLVLDLYYVGNQPQLLQTVRDLCPHLALVQVSDMNFDDGGRPRRCQIGEGVIPVQNWYDTLEEAGYQGPYEFELHGPNFRQSRYRKMLDDSITRMQQLHQQSLLNRSLSAS